MTTCFHCNAEHPFGHFERLVHNKTALSGPWAGWRMAGRELVAPDGMRISPERLRGLAWQQQALSRNSARADNARRKAVRQVATVKVLVVNPADWQQRHFGRSAG